MSDALPHYVNTSKCSPIRMLRKNGLRKTIPKASLLSTKFWIERGRQLRRPFWLSCEPRSYRGKSATLQLAPCARPRCGCRHLVALQCAAISPLQCTILHACSEPELCMFWTGFFIGFAACLAIGLTAHFVHDRRRRSAFIASLSPAQRERLRGFERVKGDWHEFRDLLHH